MKRLIALIVATMALVSLSACNTVRGVGQDIEKGGEAIQKAAKK
ncbi:entericidin A/B family lipoprotein [Denitromonas ohlonensis]|jgi:predicted small secreted protein|uniref:Entericidin A/B family lipoprotein n=2 Tax=Denitromonas TaxID=139331 RepID=A0A557RVJ2_9RHOO|nr:entericidin A/B family lipoprotein [Denitromonas ohlonensis]TVT50324.1 MAG: entericidin A/B family lipoprotein [Denitromonas halophila]TVO69176.1 entericidin A/B family lipoprotein [Denitromonas ohlonensis]TVO77276.1 entericidin A/B family lipoprotein [Denitromonas ohlonensis]TVT74995.1 MAG: entericidin A/B family lipoprotein [Denitromonas halophila]TVT78101.1 MAG: entericidin A/B family lipoprotein [Denitromonas halophila]